MDGARGRRPGSSRRVAARNPASPAGVNGLPDPEREVRILRIAGGGDGVGRLADGRTVFVPRTAPGDLVEVRYFKHASRFSRARVVRVLEPGPSRVVPPCPHYTRDQCGGCQLQHLTQGAQLSAKQSIIGEALRRVGGLSIEDPGVIPAGRPWEYRSKITLAVDPRGRIGLHPWDQPSAVFDLQQAQVLGIIVLAITIPFLVYGRRRRAMMASRYPHKW